MLVILGLLQCGQLLRRSGNGKRGIQPEDFGRRSLRFLSLAQLHEDHR